MCGITGVFSRGPQSANPADFAQTLKRMASTLDHRGPDDNGVWCGPGVGFGHTRLSVIDLSSAAHQPMATADQSLCTVFNGEIYNFQSLRAELERDSYAFRTSSDTEVILHGYHRWGVGVFKMLRGMFAIAIWDRNANQLILARDRIGKKPLFYTWNQGNLIFGSEIKAILAWPGIERTPDLRAIHHYLTLQCVPAPWSAFEGIRKLPQASYMVVHRDGHGDIRKYWELPEPSAARLRPDADVRAEALEQLDEAVRLRLISDVPLGAFLSGGVDSSAVVALMARNSSRKVKTFSIGFEESAYDERRYARLVAERCGTDHNELVVRPSAASLLPLITWHYNEPFADSSAIPTFYVSRFARQQVTVALTGDGGDESFLGYDRYDWCRQLEWVSRVPLALRRTASRLHRRIPPELERYLVPRVARRWLSYLGDRNSRRYSPWIHYFLEQDKLAGYGDRLRPYLPESSLDLIEPFFGATRSYVGGAAWADIHTYLPDDLLVKMDVASMAHGLECRSPFLDHKLMEWAAGIPVAQKLAGGTLKSILKTAMEPLLPREVLYRPKMGFGVPIDHWLRTEMKDLAYDTLLSRASTQRGLFRPDYVRSILDEHCNGTRHHHTRLWALLMLELWFRMWIDPAQSPLHPPAAA